MRAYFTDCALVLLGHGTELNEDSAGAARFHTQRIAKLGIFANVREAFWKQEPKPGVVLSSLATRRVVIVPFFLSAGYFSDVVIPRELGVLPLSGAEHVRTGIFEGREICYSAAIGCDPRITECIVTRARGVAREFPFPRQPEPAQTTLILAGHGTGRNRQSRQAVEQHAASLRALNEYAAVETVFLEENPRIPEVYNLAKTRQVIVVPFFTSEGLHTREDIPMLLGEPERLVRQRLSERKPTWRNPTERHGKLVWYSGAIGCDESVTDLVLDRAIETLRTAWPGMSDEISGLANWQPGSGLSRAL